MKVDPVILQKRAVKAGVKASKRLHHVVTREEFDVQAAILSRTRERLEQLEAVVRALEELRDRAK